MITNDKNSKFWVISDPHLIADSLHDNGQAFSEMQKTSQGKDLYYQETALKCFAKMAEKKHPAAIVVCGDITFNGERVSAQKFVQLFSNLKDTKLLVLPGNHDIYDGWAREFRKDKQYYAGQISPKMWKSIFSSSYEDCLDADPTSLAYSIQFNPDYLFICLDSNYYPNQESSKPPFTAGAIGHSELKWLQKQLEYAKSHELKTILFMHHNLYAHHQIINKNYVVDDTKELQKLCKQYDVKLLFSGHIHAQHILGPQKEVPTTEIVTSSFCTTDQGYGTVEVSPNELKYQRNSFDMTPYLDKKENDWTLKHFHEYLKNLQLASIASKLVQDEFHKSPDELTIIRQMGHVFGQINYDFFVGQGHTTEEKVKKLHTLPAYKKIISDYPEYEDYLSSLYDTSSHNNLQVDIKY